MLHIRVSILVVVLMVQYEVATSITRKTSSLSNFEREHHIYKEQNHLDDTTISVQNPTASFKVKRHAGTGSSAHIGYLKWKAYKKRRNRNRNQHHRYASKPTRFHERPSRNNHHHQYRDRPKKVFFEDDDYPRRDEQYYRKEKPQHYQYRDRPKNVFFEDDDYPRIDEQYYRKEKPQYHQYRDRPKKVFFEDDDYPQKDDQYYRKEIPSVPAKHAVKYLDQPRPVKKQRTVIKVHKPWKKLIPWVTARPGKIPDEFSLEEPLPELGGSPPSYPTKPGFPKIYQNVEHNVPYKYESYKNPISIHDSDDYPSDFNSLEDEDYLKHASSEFGTLASASDDLAYNKYSPIVENMRDYNWYDYNKHIYSFSTEPSLANEFTEYRQYETIPITEYYQQNYNTPEPVTVLKEPFSSADDLAIAYSDTAPDVVELEEKLNQHEHMPITEYKRQNHSQLSESVLQEPLNRTKSSSTLNLKVISAHQMDEILKNKEKAKVENIFPPFKKESTFSRKRNITKYYKPIHRLDTENEKNSSVYNGHTYDVHSKKVIKSGEDLGENFVTITPDKKRREHDVPDKVYDITTRGTDLRRNQDAMNQQIALRRRRIVKKGGVRKSDQDIQEAILTNIMFVDDNIH